MAIKLLSINNTFSLFFKNKFVNIYNMSKNSSPTLAVRHGRISEDDWDIFYKNVRQTIIFSDMQIFLLCYERFRSYHRFSNVIYKYKKC